MNRKLAAAAWMGIFAFGMSGCGEIAPEGKISSEEVAGPIAVYRADAAFDADGRHFLLWGDPGMLTRIHGQLVEEFISRPGMGMMRMVPKTAPKDWVELVPESEGDRQNAVAGGKALPPKYDAKIGTLTLPDGTNRAVFELVWRLREQQLVSVNAETGPAVYLQAAHSDHDRMKQSPVADSKNTPKRKLDEFETAALVQLREGNEVALQTSSHEMRVLGAIRARPQCLSCHQVPVDTMLGAFSYKLHLQTAAMLQAESGRALISP